MRAACQYPKWQPTRENPAGDCLRQPVTHGAPLGRTGLWLALCAECAPHRADAIPAGQVPEP